MKFFKLFACCIPVKGYAISIICDLQRHSHIYIPDSLFEILTTHQNRSTSDIKKSYENIFDERIDEYFDYLVSQEYGFYCDNPEQFPAIDLQFETPEIINNAVIDINKNSQYDYAKVFNELDFLGCRYLEFRVYDPIAIEDLERLMQTARGKRFKNIDLYIPYSDATDSTIIFEKLLEKYDVIGRIVVHSSPFNKSYPKRKSDVLFFIVQEIKDETCCGFISRNYFTYDIKSFSEAQKWNTCLNKKISIDSLGRIKNCPALPAHYGSVHDTHLAEVVANKEFREIWSVNKDQIKVCQDCQFRYICTDCRAFLNNADDKPKKCNYDPYRNVWES